MDINREADLGGALELLVIYDEPSARSSLAFCLFLESNVDPVSLLNLSFGAVKVANSLLQISDLLNVSATVVRAQLDMRASLRGIERQLHVQIQQPLKSALEMLQDAEAEADYNFDLAKDLAKKALEDFNKAEGQIHDDENRLIAVTGKACSYKLLGMVGAYNRAAEQANAIMASIEARKARILSSSSDTVKLACPNCSRANVIALSNVGLDLPCLHCKHVFNVPLLPES